jgi:hypothetical protein
VRNCRSVSLRGFVRASAVACAIAAAGCGEAQAPVRGAPAPPEPTAETECDGLEADPSPAEVELEPSAAGGPPYGFNDHSGLVGTIPIAEDAELIARAGGTLWRVALDWRFAEPEPDEIDLATHDAIYCEGLARGIRPIFHITGSPEWAADRGGCPVVSCLYPPRESALADLRDFAAAVARRYPHAAAIEAWNEPNLATFWAEPDPDRYVRVLAAIAGGVESSGSPVPVLGGALSNTGGDADTRTDFAPFVRRMYRAGAAEHLDGFSFHPYPIAPLGEPGERFTETMARLRRALAESGAAGTPIWVTEVGLPVTSGIGDAEVARTMSGIYRRLGREPDVEAVVFHTLLEGGIEAGSGDGFGWLIRTEDGEIELRPVYERFAELDR